MIAYGPYQGLTHLNRHEEAAFRSPIPLEQYPLNEDPRPLVIQKSLEKVHYVQQYAVKYLDPGFAPKPGDLIIRERETSVTQAPPLIVRQQGSRPHTPEPLVYREAPPAPPPRVPEQVIEIKGRCGAISPRRVIIERMGNLPPRPRDIIVEKWLPYRQQKRRVVHQRGGENHRALVPHNLIIEWSAPDVEVSQQCRDLGVHPADPQDYIRRHGDTLKQSHDLPSCNDDKLHHHVSSTVEVTAPTITYGNQSCQHVCLNCTPSQTEQQQQTTVSTTTGACTIHYGTNSNWSRAMSNRFEKAQINSELEGDVSALRLIDLDRYGLSQVIIYF